MKKYLEYKDEKSSKFWEVTVNNTEVTIRCGTTGADGTVKTTSFDNEIAAIKQAEKDMATKIEEGYIEVVQDVSQTTNTTVVSMNQLLEAADLQEALVKYFSFLADNKGFDKVLSAIMKEAQKVYLKEDVLTVEFPNDELLECQAPADLKEYKEWPKSFQNIVKHHEYISFPETGWSLNLGDVGNFEYEFLEEVESALLECVENPADILCPITDYSDWWLYHPKEKNSQNETAICFFSHEGGDVEPCEELNVGSLFLKQMATILEIEIDITSIK